MLHSQVTLARFQEGEPRFVYARSSDGRLFELEHGKADAVREWAKAHLLCPVVDCESRQITTVGRSHGRDGFKHLKIASDHAPESYLHIEAKAMVSGWLRGKYPRLTIVEEEYTNSSRERKADILVTGGPETIAIEVQFSDITLREWVERHESYRSQSIVDVWLWGHTAQLRRPRGAEGGRQVTLSLVQQELVARGLPLLWVNRELRLLGTAVESALIDHRRGEVTASGSVGAFVCASVDDFKLHPVHGLVDGRVELLLEAGKVRQRVHGADIAAAKIRAERERQEAASARRSALAAKAAEAEAVAVRVAQWLSADGAALLREFEASWPDWLEFQTATKLPLPAAAWQPFLWNACVRNAHAGEWLQEDELRQALVHTFGNLQMPKSKVIDAIREWCDVLVDHRVLEARSPLAKKRGGGRTRYVVPWVRGTAFSQRYVLDAGRPYRGRWHPGVP